MSTAETFAANIAKEVGDLIITDPLVEAELVIVFAEFMPEGTYDHKFVLGEMKIKSRNIVLSL